MTPPPPLPLAEAIRHLANGARPIAGCTDILAARHAASGSGAEPLEFGPVVDLTRVGEIRGIRIENGSLSIGAGVTFTELRANALARQYSPALVAAAGTIGAWQIQNRATIGGNIANASPAGDSLPPLLALDATLQVAGPQGRRAIPYSGFHTGYRRTLLARDEIIERVLVPIHETAPWAQAFRKVGTRQAQAISKVVAAFCALPEGNRLRAPRLAFGSVGPTPIRLSSVEDLIAESPLSEGLADHVERATAEAIVPIDDVRSTAAYRRFAAGRIARRFILDLLN